MAVEIRIHGSNEESHQNKEKIKYFVYCYSCPSVREEDGDYGPPPLEMSWIPEDLPLEQVVSMAKDHEKGEGKKHRIVVSGVVQDLVSN